MKKGWQRNYGYVVSALVILMISKQGFGQSLPAVSPAAKSQIEQEQAQRLEQLEQAKKEVENLPLIPESSGLSEVDDERCFDIETITFSGNTIYSHTELIQSLKFEPDCLGLGQINEYLRVITNLYVESGYVTSRAFLVPQDLMSGNLEIVILEGKLEGILLNGHEDRALNLAFPNSIGQVLNLRDIEQGLDQINRLSRYDAQIKLLPSKVQGYTYVDIQTQEGKFGSVKLGFGNGGQPSTGEELVSVNIVAENLIGTLDSWNLSFSKSSEFVSSRDSENVYLSTDIPYGYWNFGYRTSYSTYQSTFTSHDFTFDSSGKTNSHFADVSWLFHRNATGKSKLKFGITHRREKNYLLGNLLESGSRNLSNLSLSLIHSRRLGPGYWTIEPSFSMGSDWFGGESDDAKQAADPKAQYYKGKLTSSYSYPIASNLVYASTAYGQWTNHTLYGAERISIGGEYSVRGFKDISLSGDEGYYWRNDLTYRFEPIPLIGSFSAQLAIDTGSIAKDKEDVFERGTLTGTSLSLRAHNSHYSSRFTIGFPISAPSRLNPDDYVIYYQIDLMI